MPTTAAAAPDRALAAADRLKNRRVPLAHAWHRTLASAREEARRTHKPILQLWLLGQLDEELSCANSRFFRKTLYPDARVHAALRDHFVLCWHSFRPVPVVTIDMGDGRALVRTLTGNSAHMMLDMHGRPVDAFPGVIRPRAFVRWLAWAGALARDTAALDERARRVHLARAHRSPPALPVAPAAARRTPSARDAGVLAATKLRVEAPLLEGTRDLFESLADDERKNVSSLWPQVQARFVDEDVGPDPIAFGRALYRDVFLMPHDDPWLGLRTGDSALWDDGVVDDGDETAAAIPSARRAAPDAMALPR